MESVKERGREKKKTETKPRISWLVCFKMLTMRQNLVAMCHQLIINDVTFTSRSNQLAVPRYSDPVMEPLIDG